MIPGRNSDSREFLIDVPTEPSSSEPSLFLPVPGVWFYLRMGAEAAATVHAIVTLRKYFCRTPSGSCSLTS